MAGSSNVRTRRGSVQRRWKRLGKKATRSSRKMRRVVVVAVVVVALPRGDVFLAGGCEQGMSFRK